jgi:hypothetical protein
MHPFVLRDKERHINNRQKHYFIKIVIEPATRFGLLGVTFRLIVALTLGYKRIIYRRLILLEIVK